MYLSHINRAPPPSSFDAAAWRARALTIAKHDMISIGALIFINEAANPKILAGGIKRRLRNLLQLMIPR